MDNTTISAASAAVALPEPLPLGAHLTVARLGYTHHGIYAGNGRVIHYAGFIRRPGGGRIEEIPLKEFSRGRWVRVKVSRAPKYPGAVAVERARSRLGERRYRLWSNNCEHFCEWCVSGTSRSHQIDSIARAVRTAMSLQMAMRAAGAFRPALHSKRATTVSQFSSNTAQ